MSQKAPCPKPFQDMIQGMKMCVTNGGANTLSLDNGGYVITGLTNTRVVQGGEGRGYFVNSPNLPIQEVCRVERGEVIL